MKKFILLTILISSLAFVSQANAAYCDAVYTQQQYTECCVNDTSTTNKEQCGLYEDTGGDTTPIRTPAQSTAYCQNLSGITNDTDYAECCSLTPGVAYDQNKCYPWFAKKNGFEGGPDGTIKGGAPGTNPIIRLPSINGNPTMTSNGNTFVTPQSSSAELAACSAIKFKSLLDILIWIKCVITSVIIPLIFVLAFLFFLWNVMVFMRTSDKTNKEEAKQRMGWGIIALFIMLSVWGIITILSNTLGIAPSVPLLQTESYLDPSKASQ